VFVRRGGGRRGGAAGGRDRGGGPWAAARNRALDRVRELQRRIQGVSRDEARGLFAGDGDLGVFAGGDRECVQTAVGEECVGRHDGHFVFVGDARQLRLHGAGEGGAGVGGAVSREVVQRGQRSAVQRGGIGPI